MPGTGWPHTMQYPVHVLKRYWSSSRIWGTVGTRAVFFDTGAMPELLSDQEPVGDRRHGHVMVPPQPATSFEVVKPELVLELRVIFLDPPTRLRPANELHERDARRGGDEPVFCRLGSVRGPFDEQPLLVRRWFACMIPMGWPHAHPGEARPEFPFAALPPRHGVERGGQQRACDLKHTGWPAAPVAPAGGRPPAPGIGPAAAARPTRPYAGPRFDAHGIRQAPRPQLGPELRDRTVAGVRNHPLIPETPAAGVIEQVEGQAPLRMVVDRARDPGRRAAFGVIRPCLWQKQRPIDGQTRRRGGVMQADRHLAVGDFAQRPRVLPRYADGMRALLGKPGVIDDPQPRAHFRTQHARQD